MGPKKKGKGKDKAARLEAERLLEAEELERQAAAEEKRQRLKERRQKEAERIRVEEESIRQEEAEKRKKQYEEISALVLEQRTALWEIDSWNSYLYKTRELDYLQLPVVNGFLSEWDDDENYYIYDIFSKIEECLSIMDKIREGIFTCPVANDKNLEHWKEAIENIKQMIAKKLDIASTWLLKDANKYLNTETQNMEFSVQNDDEEHSKTPTINICLWANLCKKNRQQGCQLLEHSFQLPKELVINDCAVRLLYTLFDHSTSEFVEKRVVITEEEVETQPSASVVDSEDESISTAATDDVERAVEMLNELPILEEEDVTTETPQFEEEIAPNDELTEQVTDNVPLEIMMEGEMDDSGDKIPEIEDQPDYSIDFPDESESQILSMGQYFTVGGIFHFHLLTLPEFNVELENWKMIYIENEELQKIEYKAKIRPIRKPRDDMPEDIAEAFNIQELKRYEEELTKAAHLKLQLPKTVIYMEDPLPGRLIPGTKDYTISGIFESNYDKENRKISFSTNEFGIFGMFQKKYANMPYESWNIFYGKDRTSTVLSIQGICVNLKIEISNNGCCVRHVVNEGKEVIEDIYDEWMTADQLIKKLMSYGVNIEVADDANVYFGDCKKDRQVEMQSYKCMALLGSVCEFSSCIWHDKLPPDLFILKYKTVFAEEKMRLASVSSNRTVQLQSEEQGENLKSMKNQKFYSDLFHLIAAENLMEDIKTTDSKFIDHLFSLLQRCNLLSCL